MKRDPLEYVLNRMEFASRMSNPAQHGYGFARKELLDGITSLRAALVAKETAEAALCSMKEAFGFRTAWPIMDVLDRLAAFATMMLRERNYDGHGWEELQVAAQIAPHLSKAIMSALSSSAPCPHEAEAKRLRDDVVSLLSRIALTEMVLKEFDEDVRKLTEAASAVLKSCPNRRSPPFIYPFMDAMDGLEATMKDAELRRRAGSAG